MNSIAPYKSPPPPKPSPPNQSNLRAMGLEFDPAFVQAAEHRPNPTAIDAGSIPLIDLSPLLDSPVADAALVAEVESACREWGFFQVINHGVAPELLDRVMSVAKDFFDLPVEEKRRVRRDEINPMGYYDAEHTKNVRDWKEVFDFVADDPMLIPASADADSTELQRVSNQWPDFFPSLREACEEYIDEVGKLAYRLLELVSLSLGLPAQRLYGFFKENTTQARINYYPSCPFPELALGVGRHRDIGVLTVLAQDDVGGLEVKRRSDGEWIRVRPIPGSYIINLGDVVQVWSNERYLSAEHRVVVNSTKGRFSVPYFLTPAHYTVVAPLEEVVDERSPAKYRGYNWGKFVKTRKNSNFKKLAAANIQISDFRIDGA